MLTISRTDSRLPRERFDVVEGDEHDDIRRCPLCGRRLGAESVGTPGVPPSLLVMSIVAVVAERGPLSEPTHPCARRCRKSSIRLQMIITINGTWRAIPTQPRPRADSSGWTNSRLAATTNTASSPARRTVERSRPKCVVSVIRTACALKTPFRGWFGFSPEQFERDLNRRQEEAENRGEFRPDIQPLLKPFRWVLWVCHDPFTPMHYTPLKLSVFCQVNQR